MTNRERARDYIRQEAVLDMGEEELALLLDEAEQRGHDAGVREERARWETMQAEAQLAKEAFEKELNAAMMEPK